MYSSGNNRAAFRVGFTLIELSIVLVIIGLIVGGILVGQDLIRAAAVRAQISQIEKYNTAVNTFYGKYGYLPGDLNNAAASQFGFSARGTTCGGNACPGHGDGNGLIEGSDASVNTYYGTVTFGGETQMFWNDLTYANGMNLNLIDGSFSQDHIIGYAGGQNISSGKQVSLYIPEAKIGGGNYVYVTSGGWVEQSLVVTDSPNDGINYFNVGKVLGATLPVFCQAQGTPDVDMGLTVKQAYDIDKKMDDGLPQSGRVMATYVGMDDAVWASTLSDDSNPANSNAAVNFGLQDSSNYGPVTNPGNAIGDSQSTTTCYDYVTAGALPVVYSIGGNISPNNSNQVNCALSFRFQ